MSRPQLESGLAELRGREAGTQRELETIADMLAQQESDRAEEDRIIASFEAEVQDAEAQVALFDQQIETYNTHRRNRLEQENQRRTQDHADQRRQYDDQVQALNDRQDVIQQERANLQQQIGGRTEQQMQDRMDEIQHELAEPIDPRYPTAEAGIALQTTLQAFAATLQANPTPDADIRAAMVDGLVTVFAARQHANYPGADVDARRTAAEAAAREALEALADGHMGGGDDHARRDEYQQIVAAINNAPAQQMMRDLQLRQEHADLIQAQDAVNQDRRLEQEHNQNEAALNHLRANEPPQNPDLIDVDTALQIPDATVLQFQTARADAENHLQGRRTAVHNARARRGVIDGRIQMIRDFQDDARDRMQDIQGRLQDYEQEFGALPATEEGDIPDTITSQSPDDLRDRLNDLPGEIQNLDNQIANLQAQAAGAAARGDTNGAQLMRDQLQELQRDRDELVQERSDIRRHLVDLEGQRAEQAETEAAEAQRLHEEQRRRNRWKYVALIGGAVGGALLAVAIPPAGVVSLIAVAKGAAVVAGGLSLANIGVGFVIRNYESEIANLTETSRTRGLTDDEKRKLEELKASLKRTQDIQYAMALIRNLLAGFAGGVMIGSMLKSIYNTAIQGAQAAGGGGTAPPGTSPGASPSPGTPPGGGATSPGTGVGDGLDHLASGNSADFSRYDTWRELLEKRGWHGLRNFKLSGGQWGEAQGKAFEMLDGHLDGLNLSDAQVDQIMNHRGVGFRFHDLISKVRSGTPQEVTTAFDTLKGFIGNRVAALGAAATP